MITWVLFIWMGGALPSASWNYASQAECERDGKTYKRHVCVKVFVPNPKDAPR